MHWENWDRPPIFGLIQRVGKVPEADMRRTFNLGIGLAIVLPERASSDGIAYMRRKGEHPLVIGEII
jgi:phosphoribosylformylglycinamidine cyclo-ligase